MVQLKFYPSPGGRKHAGPTISNFEFSKKSTSIQGCQCIVALFCISVREILYYIGFSTNMDSEILFLIAKYLQNHPQLKNTSNSVINEAVCYFDVSYVILILFIYISRFYSVCNIE